MLHSRPTLDRYMNTRVLSLIRSSFAILALAVGLLVLGSGLAGPEHLDLGGSAERYYRIVVTPPAYWWLWGPAAIAVAAVLLVIPLPGRGK